MDIILRTVELINTILWEYILLFGLVGLGIYLTIRLRFPQFKRVFPALTGMIRDIKNKVPAPPGGMTPFQSLATAIAAQVGTGNIVGVASAIATGGPGATFWMLLSGFFGMSTIFAEAVLAQVYRHRDKDGELSGGPAYYIKNGLKSKLLAKIFAVLCILALGIVGLMVQSNSVIDSINSAFGINKVIVVIGLIIIVGSVLIGGMDRIAAFTEKVVPTMAMIYVLSALLIILINIDQFIPAIGYILHGAFTPQAISGGVLGISVQESIRFGLSRGLFSNEAGMGSTPHSHAVATTKHPAEQGFVAMIGVFISTFVICIATVLVNLVSGSYDVTVPASEMTKVSTLMTQQGFENSFGAIGAGFLSISLSCFALTTIVGWYFFAESNVKFLTKNKFIISHFKLVSLFFIFCGLLVSPGFVWDLADLFMGLMAVPNLITVFFLSNQVIKVLRHYDHQTIEGHYHWEYEFEKEH